MVVEIFTVCDAATDYGGRLNILGAFEGIAATRAPVVRERCSIAVRLRFEEQEASPRQIAVRILDPEGAPVVPEMQARMAVGARDGPAAGACNLVLNFNRLRFPAFGVYRVTLLIDQTERLSLPLTVAQVKRQSRGRSPMEN